MGLPELEHVRGEFVWAVEHIRKRFIKGLQRLTERARVALPVNEVGAEFGKQLEAGLRSLLLAL